MSGKTDSDIDVQDSAGSTVAGRDVHGVPFREHVEELKRREAELKAEHAEKVALVERANDAEKRALTGEIEGLNARIAELEARLADPEAAYAEYRWRIAELEALLENATVEIGGNRIAAAKAAMAKGDYSEAEEIFAEVQAQEKPAVRRAAEAAFGLGLIAEEEVRWRDAAAQFC